MNRRAHWRSALIRRFRWTRLRYDWGRWCTRLDACGRTVSCWWEWERR